MNNAQDIVTVLQRQRDQALNMCVQIEAALLAAEREIAELKVKLVVLDSPKG
jgi:hypothetical protein